MFSIDPLLIGSLAVGIAILLPVMAKKGKEVKSIDREEVFCRTGLRVITEEEKSIVAYKMVRAGKDEKPEHLWGRKIIYTASYILLVAILGLLFKLHPGLIFLMLCGAILVWFFPDIQLNTTINKRKNEIIKKLDEFSMYLSTALNSMPDVTSALKEAGEATGGVYANEVNIILKENHSGKNLTDALYDWGERVDVDEINTLISALDQIHVKGVSASEKMKDFSDRFRMIKRFETMEQAGKLSIRLIFVVMIFMLIPTMLVIGYPAAYSLMQAL